MSQIKFIIFLSLAAASLHAKAQSMSGYLDFSKLGRDTNAGSYFVGVALNPKDRAVLEITQTQVEPPSAEPGSVPEVCFTEIRLNAGNFSFLMTDSRKDKAARLTQDMNLFTSNYDDSEKCTSPEQIVGGQLNFIAFINLGGFNLDYRAPQPYNKIISDMSIFPYGYSVTLNVTKDSQGQLVVENLKSQLAAQVKRGNKEGMSYYVYAEDDNFSLELGSGYVELK